MVKYLLRNGVTVSIESNAPDDAASIIYEGEPVLIASVKKALSESYGAFGHLIGDEATPIDLDSAMSKSAMSDFTPKIATGEGLVKQYTSNVPSGVST